MKKVIYWATIACGVAAAYLMYKRGVPVLQIAQKAATNPLGALVNEVQHSA